ncbi:MAG: 16S rRNA (cytidine(1402)-2'-O)-methyltransferase [Desulfovibrio sp.]|jgi:16S rRNA (cytidine1402-2'-O)-methyltransferase|nr:16S rRNA (cytidine(1402)-2'-O)-methyltransferase [Desulfovibrio sp.]
MEDAHIPAIGVLKVVATPLGNMGDLSPRAREALESADLILAEDTRRTSRLCAEAGVVPKRLLSFFEHNEDARRETVLELLRQGRTVALASDAGTPLLADPGYGLVRACRLEGIPVVPVPGPSAPACALSVAGLPPIPYTFLGFLPRHAAARRQLLESFARVPGSLVFFERKNRLAESLAQALEILGDREAAICRELTKIHEELILGRLSELAGRAADLLGEITVVVGPPGEAPRTPESDVRGRLASAVKGGAAPREAVRLVMETTAGWSAKDVYALLLEPQRTPGDSAGDRTPPGTRWNTTSSRPLTDWPCPCP